MQRNPIGVEGATRADRPATPVAWPPPKPAASCLTDYEWLQQSQLTRHGAGRDEPWLMEERHDRVRLTWRLEEGREARLHRLAVLDPDAGRGAWAESWLRDRVVETVAGVPQIALPVVAAGAVLVVWLTHGIFGRFALAIACGVATLLIAPLVWRTRRLWRHEQFGRFSPPEREREHAMRALAAEHADAWRTGDAAARDVAVRRVWAALPRGD